MLWLSYNKSQKAGKEKKTPSPKEVLADMFPEIEQESMEEKVSVSPAPAVRKPQSSRMQNQSIIRKAVASPLAENKRENRTPIKLSTKEEARRAFIYQKFLIENINNNYTNKE